LKNRNSFSKPNYEALPKPRQVRQVRQVRRVNCWFQVTRLYQIPKNSSGTVCEVLLLEGVCPGVETPDIPDKPDKPDKPDADDVVEGGAYAVVQNLINIGKHLVRAEHYRDPRVSAFEKWGRAVARDQGLNLLGLGELSCQYVTTDCPLVPIIVQQNAPTFTPRRCASAQAKEAVKAVWRSPDLNRS
jgi:hypothetical protein